MERYTEAVNNCLKESDWKDLLLVKACLCAVGALIGMMLPVRRKWVAAWGASLVMVASYVPVMSKFLPHLLCEKIAIEDIYKK